MRKFNGFSLMEMMVVLLIVAIVMAASAPMISKRMVRTAEGGSPWLFSGMNGSIFFNGNGNNRTAMIGRSDLPDGVGEQAPRLLIDAGNNNSTAALSIYRNGGFIANLIARENTVGFARFHNNSESPQLNSVYIGTNQLVSHTEGNQGNAVGIGCGTNIHDQSTVIGAFATANDVGAIAIGSAVDNSTTDKTYAKSPFSIAIGNSAKAGFPFVNNNTADSSIAIGNGARIGYNGNAIFEGSSNNSIAIGTNTQASALSSVAIGSNARATALRSVAIGSNAQATALNSVAIGGNAVANKNNTIVLGRSAQNVRIPNPRVDQNGHITIEYNEIEVNPPTTVHIPGNLVVDGMLISRNLWFSGKDIPDEYYYNIKDKSHNHTYSSYYPLVDNDNNKKLDELIGVFSDRRLKNVGEMFTGGLEQVKKLEVYNYTFKKDSANTPRVGVMAQDLMKVFPNAVTKGEDGYLRIRMEDMFYAVVNAVKELDNKLTALIEQVKTIADDMSIIKNKNTEYERVITELVEQNKALMKKNAEFEERLAKLEGKAIKKETKEMTKAVKQESKLAKQEEKAKLKAQKQAEKLEKKAAKDAEKAAKKVEKE